MKITKEALGNSPLVLMLILTPVIVAIPILIYHFLIFPNFDGIAQDISIYNYDEQSQHYLYWSGFWSIAITFTGLGIAVSKNWPVRLEFVLLLISGVLLFGGAGIIIVQTCGKINRTRNRVWSGISFMIGGLLVQVILVLVMMFNGWNWYSMQLLFKIRVW